MKEGRPDTFSAEEVEKIKARWAEGASASDLGKELDRSRNSIIGKVHRLKLPLRGNPVGTSNAQRNKVRAKPTGQKHRKIAPPMAGNATAKRMILGQGPAELDAPPIPIKAEAFLPLPGSSPVTILAHKDGCRWPVGEAPALLCNLEREEKPRARLKDPVQYFVYCRTHNHMARSRR